MDAIAFILALAALDVPAELVAGVIADYIEEHPEAIAEVTVATVADTEAYLGIE